MCRAKITLGKATFQTQEFEETSWVQTADIIVQDEKVGDLSVWYVEERPAADEGPFLKEERRLINTIVDRLERRLLHEQLRSVFEKQSAKTAIEGWRVVLR